ncbi:formate dehydrogenase subunit gamma [Celeribacter arenosi]|uniref:Formate dehydrogenase subunit gamma n=1 Tax=Celeribacter arenosi TaxID=792649 RepID=A0ABP7K438_9RHOB
MHNADHSDAADHDAAVDAVIEAHRDMEGPLLPILHGVMARIGYIPQDALPRIAKALGMTAAEVHGVVSFYHDFRTAPVGQKVIKICRAEACQAMGAAALEQRVLAQLGLPDFGTTADGKVTVEPVYCLGLCACGPAALVDGAPRGRVTAELLTGGT